MANIQESRENVIGSQLCATPFSFLYVDRIVQLALFRSNQGGSLTVKVLIRCRVTGRMFVSIQVTKKSTLVLKNLRQTSPEVQNWFISDHSKWSNIHKQFTTAK